MRIQPDEKRTSVSLAQSTTWGQALVTVLGVSDLTALYLQTASFCHGVKIDFLHRGSAQWRRNEIESGGNGPEREWGQSAGNFFLVVPLHFVTLKAQLVILVSAFVMVSTV